MFIFFVFTHLEDQSLLEGRGEGRKYGRIMAGGGLDAGENGAGAGIMRGRKAGKK